MASKQLTKNKKGFTTFSSRERGFTLIELLVVMGILAVLLAIVLIAINPIRQFAQAQNRKRLSDVNAILNAFGAYAADNKGALPTDIPTSQATEADITAADCSLLVPTYISALPNDPTSGTTFTDCAHVNTGYKLYATGSRLTVEAPSTDTTHTSDTEASVTR